MLKAVIHVLLLLTLVVFVAPRLHAAGIRDAQSALFAAEYESAADLANPLRRDPRLAPGERAEAERVYGLALFALGRRAEAEEALLAYLRAAPEGHLDPAIYPPEMIVFMEEVRTRHAGELLTLRPRPPKKRYFVLNLLPPFGQIQNGDTVKAWFIGAGEIVFLAANITTYALLRSTCDDQTLICDDPGRAQTLRTLNFLAAGLLAATYVYGVVDGLVGYGRSMDVPTMGFAPVERGGVLFWSGTFGAF